MLKSGKELWSNPDRNPYYSHKKKSGSGYVRFRRQMGLFLISFALGMLLMMFVSNLFWGIVIMIALLLVGYNLYCN